jgi:hypothetical protein
MSKNYRTQKIDYSDYWCSISFRPFVPNWKLAKKENGKPYSSAEEAMLYAIKGCLGKGAVMVWHNQVFSP